MPSMSMPPPLAALLSSDALHRLLSPSDLVILAVLLLALLLGCRRGFLGTVLGLFSGLAALVCAGFAAKATAPYMARFLVTPIVGEVFERQATAALSGAAAPTGEASLSGISGALQSILRPEALQNATEPLRQAAAQAAQSMAESLSYFVLFFVLLLVFTALFRLVGGALGVLAHLGPIGLLNGALGGALGLAGGAFLVLLVLWGLTHFAPATFTELGLLSPAAVDQTLLTKTLLGLLAPAV